MPFNQVMLLKSNAKQLAYAANKSCCVSRIFLALLSSITESCGMLTCITCMDIITSCFVGTQASAL